jgi:two-component SAPR family response regulator
MNESDSLLKSNNLTRDEVKELIKDLNEEGKKELIIKWMNDEREREMEREKKFMALLPADEQLKYARQQLEIMSMKRGKSHNAPPPLIYFVCCLYQSN